MEPKPHGPWRFILEKSPTLLLGALAAIFIHWAATGAEEHIKLKFQDVLHSPVFYVGCGIAALVCSLIVWHLREKHRAIEDRHRIGEGQQIRAGQHRCQELILFVSPQNPALLTDRPPVNGPVRLRNGDVSLDLERMDLATDIEKIATSSLQKWNWEPLLRGVAQHRGVLQRIHLLGSAGGGGSFAQLEIARDFLRAYLPDVTIECGKQALPFEDVEALAKAVQDLLKNLGAVDLNQVCIDVTGGQKTTSIAGVLATLKTPVINQYVQTGSKREVLTYDLRFSSPLEHEGAD